MKCDNIKKNRLYSSKPVPLQMTPLTVGGCFFEWQVFCSIYIYLYEFGHSLLSSCGLVCGTNIARMMKKLIF